MGIQKKQKGFTIIEVVLVLAIAALILLMVFIAYPALARGQRDSQRKNDMARFQVAVSNYSAANKGNIPTNTTALNRAITDGLTSNGDVWSDPQGSTYAPSYFTGAQALPGGATAGTVYYISSATCNDSGSSKSAGARQFAILVKLEQGSSCLNN